MYDLWAGWLFLTRRRRQFCRISCVKRLSHLSSSAVWRLCVVHSDWSDWQAHPVSAVCLFCDHQSETMDQIYTHMKVRQHTLSVVSAQRAWNDSCLMRCWMQQNTPVGFWSQISENKASSLTFNLLLYCLGGSWLRSPQAEDRTEWVKPLKKS